MNYYHLAEPHPVMPSILGGEVFDTVAIGKALSYNHNFWKEYIAWAKNLGVEVGVGEMQMEPWPPYFTPGKDAKEFRFVTMRCLQNVLNPDKKSLIGIWGIELFTKRFMKT